MSADILHRLEALAVPSSRGKLDGPAAVVATRAECGEAATEIAGLRTDNERLVAILDERVPNWRTTAVGWEGYR